MLLYILLHKRALKKTFCTKKVRYFGACYAWTSNGFTAIFCLMIDTKILDEISNRLAGSMPAGLQAMQDDFRKNVRSAVEASLKHLNLVTREEFDAQTKVLARTRSKLEALEKLVSELEKQQK